ncbi:hypothetical protein KBY83_13715 [Cyanobium sp. WKJ7-Wakatipu]|uniref:hypothetical protein n=1 Tax=Cyanobium sp. WKJ7-Wakatipu TaxID=2823726 RepID=UPI0020CD1419|nr:hypothetical protein [Cyanobium sp. WKJ7-Wakatipu]MCP9784355.1 hypothetical protein [Cyanobium sp. WKJ7-Wakatipu]
MARLEALLKVKPSAEECRQTLNQLAVSLVAELTWLDPRNACLSLNAGASGLPVQVFMELRGPDQLGVLVNSREGMGSGAPLSHAVLEQALDLLLRLLPGSALVYRSDRDGPIRQGSGQRTQT